MADTPADQAQLIEGDFGRLMSLALALGDAARVGDWSVKQVVAHLAAWDLEVRIALDEVVDGRPAHYANWDEDVYNRRIVQRAESLTWQAVLAEARSANAALCAAVRTIAPVVWNRPSGFQWPDGSPMTPASVLAYTYKGQTHYAGHASELEGLDPGALT